MNKPLLNSQRYPLPHIVLEDIFLTNKVAILLLFFIGITSLATIWVTHQTRLLVSEKGNLIFEKQALENEYINLKLEETTLGNNIRIESIANRIGMKSVDPTKEVIIIE